MKKFQQVVDSIGFVDTLILYADKLNADFWKEYSLSQLLQFFNKFNGRFHQSEKLQKFLTKVISDRAKTYLEWRTINEAVSYSSELKQLSSEKMEALAETFEQLAIAMDSIPRSYNKLLLETITEMSIENRHRVARIWGKMIKRAKSIEDFKYLWDIKWLPRERKPTGEIEAQLIARNFLKHNKDKLGSLSVFELNELYLHTLRWESAEIKQLLSNMITERSSEVEYDLDFWTKNHAKIFSEERVYTEIQKCIPTFNDWLRLFIKNGSTWYLEQLCDKSSLIEFTFSNYGKAKRVLSSLSSHNFSKAFDYSTRIDKLFYSHLNRLASSFEELLIVFDIILDRNDEFNNRDAICEIIEKISKINMSPSQLRKLTEFCLSLAYNPGCNMLLEIILERYSTLDLSLDEWLEISKSRYVAIKKLAQEKMQSLI